MPYRNYIIKQHRDGLKMSDENIDKNGVIKSLISSGAEIAGSALGGALGFLAGGPVGAAAGGLVAQ